MRQEILKTGSFKCYQYVSEWEWGLQFWGYNSIWEFNEMIPSG